MHKQETDSSEVITVQSSGIEERLSFLIAEIIGV